MLRLCRPEPNDRFRDLASRSIQSKYGQQHAVFFPHLTVSCSSYYKSYWTVGMDGLWANGARAPTKLTAVCTER